MLGTGIGMTIAGLGINMEGPLLDNDATNNDKGLWLSYVGAATTIASIPFFITAGKNKRQATLSLKNEISPLNNLTINNSNYTSIALTIEF